ncbi:hypothetical protein ECTW09098_0489 [Escherichia coli TW09098]|nr:hypothetical protein ECDEC3B_0199 [Escherichia coli DEC3B]EHU82675.1 hypothetical protein ECDEC3D_0361 [Escherichia coli DEC3D]EHU84729.1 hypothetical protein ECDEC3E_0526 [Escherichia coli DEC3E]EIN66999.1 hypothetical protein ECPA9_0538 [Escherichia coli PA9]EIO50564.1 hypothetical protein ECTW07945_5741 [Escherichia coli TW07945]EIO52345.1 hypothetical protein ECPA39_0408 [Escherichia coli PA39]EIO89416.1 hypothetical protein ECTW09098_0489 [Escherichia coli TW09098]EIP54641.1 hypothet
MRSFFLYTAWLRNHYWCFFKRSVADHNKISAKKEMECQLAYRYTDEMITCIAIHSQVE